MKVGRNLAVPGCYAGLIGS